ncbi:hypothetical protein A2U01_0101126, partial [Trifolium medium]|nr:hypothetical protein [Trifolium medium]
MKPSQHDGKRFILEKSVYLLIKKTAVSQHDGANVARWQVSEAIVIRWNAMGYERKA